MGVTRFVFVGLVFLLFHKVTGQNCTTLFKACKATIEPDQEKSTSSQESEINPCTTATSREKLCTSYQSFWICVNNTMANCRNDQAIQREIDSLQWAYNGYCRQEAICGDRIGKCYCDADLVSDVNNITKMCNNYQHFTQCIGKLKDCDAGEIRQQAALFIAMIEAICKTACPEAFQCFMGSEGQTKSLLGPSDVTGNICRDLIPRFQCLTNNTRTCSASVSDKWQRVVTSYKEVCSEFDEYMTDPSPCENIQRCVDKAEVVPGVTLGDWRSNETVFLTHTKEVTTGMLNPGIWCSILTHAVDCVDQLADVCNVTMKEKEMVASMKISVGNTCKDTHVSNESGISKSGFERLSSSGVLSFLVSAAALLKV
ncbi:uncharacterized protein LOC112560281 [Pomacea canaliculata]|uniref:uncharacterized protein LOC112560281 n=1 Tax=Pomacea canaliculata TaxID=400727 RepID=UPI000D72F5EE|nr:uncharacterized protein LOC112560281 [Pomacea canaliculata]